jgi:hypothetical protein
MDLDTLLDYLGDTAEAYAIDDGGSGAEYPILEVALAVEAAAQAKAVTYPDDSDSTPDLDEALCRRVACNLARRPLPLAYSMGDAEVATRFPLRDPEVRRLEAPYRKIGAAR